MLKKFLYGMGILAALGATSEEVLADRLDRRPADYEKQQAIERHIRQSRQGISNSYIVADNYSSTDTNSLDALANRHYNSTKNDNSQTAIARQSNPKDNYSYQPTQRELTSESPLEESTRDASLNSNPTTLWELVADHSSEPFVVTDDWEGTPLYPAYDGQQVRKLTYVVKNISQSGEEMVQYILPFGSNKALLAWKDEDVDHLEWDSSISSNQTRLSSTAPAYALDPNRTASFHVITPDIDPSDDKTNVAEGVAAPYGDYFSRKVGDNYLQGLPITVPQRTIPPTELSYSSSDGLLNIGITGTLDGVTYRIQKSDSLTEPNWTNINSFVANGSTNSYSEPMTNNVGFYQVISDYQN